jgi:transcription elongation factor Elf1
MKKEATMTATIVNHAGGLDGMKRCPVCHKQPAVRIETLEETVIECAPHGYIAQGKDVEQAVSHWNRFIRFVERESTQNAADNPSGSRVKSVCLFCRVETGSIIHMDSDRYWVECDKCHLVKFQKGA